MHLSLSALISWVFTFTTFRQTTEAFKLDGEPSMDLEALSLESRSVQASAAAELGPSGTLIQPIGGAVFKNHVGNVGNVEVIYKGVSDGSNTFGARTCTIDLHLVPKKAYLKNPGSYNISSSSTVSLAYGMRPHDSGSSQPIWANFVPPVGVCGEYYLVVYERQLFENTIKHFQTAAPLLNFQCVQTAQTTYPPGSVVHL